MRELSGCKEERSLLAVLAVTAPSSIFTVAVQISGAANYIHPHDTNTSWQSLNIKFRLHSLIMSPATPLTTLLPLYCFALAIERYIHAGKSKREYKRVCGAYGNSHESWWEWHLRGRRWKGG